tara:strand:+ start:1959 stop:4226 length:2268 start_codon:yes stop_codon:yes gene_type:complete
MAEFTFTDPEGNKYTAEGATQAEAFANLQSRLNPEPSLADSVTRGAGLAGRSITGAVPSAFAGGADLVGTLVNAPIAGLDKLGQLLGDEPLTTRVPTDNTAQLDALLDQVFPTPESMPERILDATGEIVLSGGAAATKLAPDAAQVASSPSTQGILRNLGDEIGEFFAKSPKTAVAVEAGGAVGASTGQELAEEAELGPTESTIAAILGGLFGGATPQGATNVVRRGATAVQNKVDSALTGEIRAARQLQESAADPEAAAKAVADAPEGVTPARATEDPSLQAIEARVLADDPKAAARVEADLETAETRTLDELANQFGPTSDRAEWQRSVIQRGAPEGAKIEAGQPDEMLDQAFKSFDDAYGEIQGFPLRTENVQVAGGDIPLRESLEKATKSKAIIADNKWRKGVQKFLTGLLDDVEGDTTPALDGGADVSSTRMLEMRSKVRAEARRRERAGRTNPRAAAEAQMLKRADQAITDVIESQLPDAVSQQLRDTDARYRDFLTVEAAVLRSGDKGLTPEALKASIGQRAQSRGAVARGDTGELGNLAETGRDVRAVLGKPEEAKRLIRGMDAEQLQTMRADMNAAITEQATTAASGLQGKKYLQQIDANEDTLIAMGFTGDEMKQMRDIGKRLQMIQSRSPGAVVKLLEDDVGDVMRLFGAIAGSKSGSRVLKALGGAGGAGPSLIVSQYGSRFMQNTLTKLSVDKADALIRAATTDKDLYQALLTKPTDTLKKQADAARTIQAWLAQVTPDEEE